MGFLDPFNDGLSVSHAGLSRPSASRRQSSRSRQKRHRSRSRARSRSRVRSSSSSRSRSRDRGGSFVGNLFGGEHSSYNKYSNASSFFGGGGHSRSSFFGFGRPSYYKRSPRHGFVNRAYRQLKRLIRDLVHWAKRHPYKVFFLVIMPLITGGALTALLARFGLRMPPSLERMLGMASRAAGGNHIGLVGDAVRMAGNFSGSSSRSMGPQRGMGGGGYGSYGGGYNSYGGGGGRRGGGWEDSVMGMAKMFI